jgi:ribosomal protein S18 acetylase RimI-like enzyme
MEGVPWSAEMCRPQLSISECRQDARHLDALGHSSGPGTEEFMDDGHTVSAHQPAKSTVVIRNAMRSDARSIAVLLNAGFVEFQQLYTPAAFVATVQPESGILGRLEEGPVWVAEKDSEVIGTVSAVCGKDSVTVRGMAVHPQARGLRIGRTLLAHVEGYVREQGYDRMLLYTTAFLLSAIRLYLSYGFRFTGEIISPHGTELLRMDKVLGGNQELG